VTINRALDRLSELGIDVQRVSSLYRTRPVGPQDQPWYVNAVAKVKVKLPPWRLLAVLKGVEREAGRHRGRRWGPRPLDIDLLDYGGLVRGWPAETRRSRLVLPHPEMHHRPFVLVPLLEVAPRWRHPVLRLSAPALLAQLPRHGTEVRALD
jgi:2-amino-4-hydroxy-6-hydroxymethyldihydropteridine diphosphokinase